LEVVVGIGVKVFCDGGDFVVKKRGILAIWVTSKACVGQCAGNGLFPWGRGASVKLPLAT
jgi:hypothetical protein